MYINKHKERGSGGGGMAPLTGFIFVVAILWILWYFGGGPQRAAVQREKPFMTAPSTLESGVIYNSVGH